VTLERRVQALLELVEADRVRQSDTILGTARSEVAAIRKQAHAEARSRMRKAFAEARERSEARIAAARAKLQTQRRVADQQRARALLAAGLARLPVELLRRWNEPEARRAWLVSLAADALAVLPRTSWHVAHPSEWASAERAEFSARLAGQVGVPPQCIADPRIRAGLKIAADGNVVDGTLDGFLVDGNEIGARLLHAIEAAS
jgi:type II secretory pathway pseudopilin PulG